MRAAPFTKVILDTQIALCFFQSAPHVCVGMQLLGMLPFRNGIGQAIQTKISPAREFANVG